MRPPKVEDQALLDGLMAVLRARGYDGSSLNELAGSSGLQKASLYHRFPGGKKEITLAVLHYVHEWIRTYIYERLTDQSVSPAERLGSVIQSIHSLYQGGEKSCILKALSMDSSVDLFGEEIKASMQLWIDGFTTLGVDCGFTRKSAQEKAFQVLIAIQGSLIVAKGLGSTVPFVSAVASIEKMYQEA